MKLKKLCHAASVALATCLVHDAQAWPDYDWTGLGDGSSWTNNNNWYCYDTSSALAPPNAGNGAWAVRMDYQTPATSTININDGDNVDLSGPDATVYGPEWGATLNLNGSARLNFGFTLAPVQTLGFYTSTINMYGSSQMTGNTIALGDTWWYWGGPYVTMNMYGNAFAGIDYMYWGGHVNMYGGILSITNGLTVETVGSVSDATRLMNLAGGKLILPSAFTGTVNDWISRGILLAYGKAQDTSDMVIDEVTMPGRTLVTIIPLGGSLQDIHLQLSPTNLTLGVSQPLTVLGDYPNVQNVVLTALDPATLPGTIVYQSSAPGVAVVDVNGLVTAIATGSATLTATLGAFSSTNSITITVTPNTNSVPRLPEEQPVFGYTYVHDPGTMIYDGIHYYIFGDGWGINVSYSTDMRNWNYTSPVFPGIPPAWTTNAVSGFTGYFWAPDEAYFNGRYNIYYACSEWGTINSAIGLVTTPSLISPVWTDQGKVIESNYPTTTNTDLTAYNCIDPSVMVDTNGTVWMSFGSYSDGILIMQLDPSTGKRIATNAPIYRVSNNGPVFFSNTEEGSCLYQHGGYYYLFVNFGGCCEGVNSTYNIRVGRSTTVTGPYYDKNGTNMLNGGGTMFLESSGRFIGPGHAAILNVNGTNWFTYHYYDGNNNGTATLGIGRLTWSADGWPVFTNDWSAFYPFNVDASEQLGLYNGTLENGAVITNEPGRGNALSLDGISQYILLPGPVANASTFAAWVKWRGRADWQRIFDFGTDTTNYLFLTPRAYGGMMRFAITTNSNNAEQQINAIAALPTNSWCHVAVTLDGSKGLLYLNGTPVATNNNLTIRPWQTLAKSNYVGKSQWPADPLFAGEIGSFRIFGRALSGAEIQDLAYAHPALAHRYSFNTNSPTAAWDSIGMAHGTLMGNAVVTNNALVLNGTAGSYVNLPGGLVSGSSALTVEFWATFGVSASWARVFDFGNISGSSGIQYFFYSPHTSLGGQRMEMSTNKTTTFDIAGTLDSRTVHVVCIVDPTNNYAAVYTNAVLESAVTNSWPAFNSVSTAWSFLGRSLFSADGWLNATIDEFRIYDGRLTPQEIATDYRFGPDALALPVTLLQSNSASGLTFSWPSWAAGFVLETTPALGTAWTTAAPSPTLISDRWWLPQSTTNRQTFYRLQR